MIRTLDLLPQIETKTSQLISSFLGERLNQLDINYPLPTSPLGLIGAGLGFLLGWASTYILLDRPYLHNKPPIMIGCLKNLGYGMITPSFVLMGYFVGYSMEKNMSR